MKLNNIMIERVEKIPFYIQLIVDHSEGKVGPVFAFLLPFSSVTEYKGALFKTTSCTPKVTKKTFKIP